MIFCGRVWIQSSAAARKALREINRVVSIFMVVNDDSGDGGGIDGGGDSGDDDDDCHGCGCLIDGGPRADLVASWVEYWIACVRSGRCTKKHVFP